MDPPKPLKVHVCVRVFGKGNPLAPQKVGPNTIQHLVVGTWFRATCGVVHGGKGSQTDPAIVQESAKLHQVVITLPIKQQHPSYCRFLRQQILLQNPGIHFGQWRLIKLSIGLRS